MCLKSIILLILSFLCSFSFTQNKFLGYLDGECLNETSQLSYDNFTTCNQYSKSSYYHNFYRKIINGRVLVGSNYSGFSGSIIRMQRERIAFGFALQFNNIYNSNQPFRELYKELHPQDQYFFIPFLLNIKLHLNHDASLGDVVPYLIVGFGPALGLYLPYGNNFFNTLSRISGQIGGGGFGGIGVDYLWQEAWAISFDIRYNFYRFFQPLGLDQEYKGVSFFIGFSRSLHY